MAMITGDHPDSARDRSISSRAIVIRGCVEIASVTVSREDVAIHRQRRAGRHPRLVRRPHHERAEPPHLLLEQADRVVELVAAERVAADELGEPSVLCTAVGRTGRIS